jgi:hypothetical protein
VAGRSEFLVNLGTHHHLLLRRFRTERVFGIISGLIKGKFYFRRWKGQFILMPRSNSFNYTCSFTSCMDGASFWSISGPLDVQFYVVSRQSEFLVTFGTLTCTVLRRFLTERVFGQSRDPHVYSLTSCLDGASFWSISGPSRVQFNVVSGRSEFLVNRGTLGCTVLRRVWTERVFGHFRDPHVYSFTSCLDGASFWSISGPSRVQFNVVSGRSEFLVNLGTLGCTVLRRVWTERVFGQSRDP